MSSPPQAETAANISVPVAQEISLSRFIMRFLFLLHVTRRRTPLRTDPERRLRLIVTTIR
ncbi:MAG: hypothetical protein CMH84_15270 [Nocardioides sp.]|nr:hypothetical protein [Nocardioides sp.]